MTSTTSDNEGGTDASLRHEAFSLLSDETRLNILQVLWEGEDPSDPTPMRFAELRDRLEANDPGRVYYHLDKLTKHFIRRTEQGYELRESGRRILRMLLSGTAIDDPRIEPVEVDISCWYCRGQTLYSYQDGWRYLRCTSCQARCVEGFPPGVLSKSEFPPSGLRARSPDEINRADRIWGSHRRAAVMDNVCPECAGDMPITSIDICDEHEPDWEEYQYCESCGSIFWMLANHVCERCKYRWRMPTLFYPTREPAVVAFYYEHGIEFDLARFEQRALLLEYEQELLSTTDPLRIRITIPHDTEALRLTFDENMEVVNMERSAHE